MIIAKTILMPLMLCLLTGSAWQEPQEVDFTILAEFTYTEGMTLPENIQALDGKMVKVHGFMSTEDGSTGEVTDFMMVNDACGCEGQPMLNEIIFCAMPEGETTKIQPGAVQVIGELHVGEEKEEDVVVALYWLGVESVQ